MTAPNPAKYRNFVFTKNNPVLDGEHFLTALRESLPVRYIIFQKEEGEETHTPHFQGYVELSKQQSHRQLQAALDGAHFEARRGTAAQAKAYCSKEDTRVDGPWEHGEMSAPGTRTDLNAIISVALSDGLRAAALADPATYAKNARGIERVRNLLTIPKIRDVEVTLLYGPAGVGKNHYVYEQHPPEDISKVIGNLKWFDDHHGQPALLLDEFVGYKAGVQAQWFNSILDKWPLQVETKGGFVPAQYTKVYIATNVHPSEWFQLSPALYEALIRRIHKALVWDMTCPHEIRPADFVYNGMSEEFIKFMKNQ